MLAQEKLKLYNLHLLVPITIAVATGILWQAGYSGTFCTLFFFVGSMVLAAVVKKNVRTRIMRASLVLVAFACGAYLYNIQHFRHEQFQQKFCGRPISLRGTVSDIGKSGKGFMRHLTTINLDAIKSTQPESSWIKIKKNVQIYSRTKEAIFIGDTIELQNITFKATRAQEFKKYLIKKGISATAFLQNPKFKLLSRPTWSVKRWLFCTREKLLNNLKKKLSPEVFGLFSSVFLGNRTEAKRETEQSKTYFKVWGILHFLARSGLHLVIFILLWEILLRFIPLAFIYKQILLFALALSYCSLSWSSVSFTRAFFIFLLYKVSLGLSTRAFLLHLLSLTCLIMMILNPTLIFFLDFQLSFGLTCALAWFGRLGLQKRKLTQKH